MIIERVSFVQDVWKSEWLFKRPEALDAKLVLKRWKADTEALVDGLAVELDRVEPFDSSSIELAFKA